MRLLLIVLFLTTMSLTGFTQDLEKNNPQPQVSDTTISYAYVLVQGSTFSRKNVTVDFGDSPEQLKMGKEYSERLKTKKSYIAILNHMIENQFKLVQTLDYVWSGTVGSQGIAYLMKKDTK